MTLFSASMSVCEVDDVAAIAAGTVGLRAGGGERAACGRVAGIAVPGVAFLMAVFVADVVSVEVVFLAEELGAMLRTIGRGFGNGTFGLAQASVANADNSTTSARLVANAVDRNAAARVGEVTAFLRGESFNRSGSAHDPPKCGRFGEKIMRFLNSLECDRTQNRTSLLLNAL